MSEINTPKPLPKPMSEYAKFYLSKGLSVIPCSRDKKPLLNWKEFQTRKATTEEIDNWFKQWPDANIGIVTGKISGITVVDVEAGGDFTKFPPTDTVKTGGGGRHFFYRYCEEMNNKARILPLTDIRGDGGFVVASPSLHASGNRYEIISTAGRSEFPSYLFGGERKKVEWKEVLSGVPKGGRNQTAASLTGKLLNSFSPSEWEGTVWIMLKNWNASNTPPMSEYELRNTYESIARKEITRRKHVDVPKELDNELPITFTNILKLAEDELDNTKPEDVISFGYDWLDNKMTGIFKGELVVIGGESGCLHPDTLIYDPVAKTNLSVKERSEIAEKFHVYSFDGEKPIIAEARVPRKFIKTQMYELSNGNYKITVTGKHRIFDGVKYTTVHDLAGSSSFLLPVSPSLLLSFSLSHE